MPLHPLKSQETHPSHVAYDKKTAHFSAVVPITKRTDGRAGGTMHIPGETICRAFGQPNADLLNINSINVTGATTNAGFSLGGHFHTGETGDGTAKPIMSHMRVHHVEGNETTATHFVVPPGNCGLNSTISPPGGLGVLDIEAHPDQKTITGTALGRELRWNKEQLLSHAELAADCTEVTSNGRSRFLAPVNVTESSCAMSKLIAANGANPTFCDGQYTPTRRKVVTRDDGKDCMIIAPHHFKQVSDTLKKNLTTQSPFKDGLTVQLESHNEADVPVDTCVHVYGTMERTPTATMFDCDHVDGETITKQKAHGFLGEDMQAAAIVPPSDADQLVEKVFSANLPGAVQEGPDPMAGSEVRTVNIADTTSGGDVMDGDEL